MSVSLRGYHEYARRKGYADYEALADTLLAECYYPAKRVGDGPYGWLPPYAYVPDSVKAYVRARDGHRCTYCGRAGEPRKDPDGRLWHMDHKTPTVRGGENAVANLALACHQCNTRKGWKTAEEFVEHA